MTPPKQQAVITWRETKSQNCQDQEAHSLHHALHLLAPWHPRSIDDLGGWLEMMMVNSWMHGNLRDQLNMTWKMGAPD